MSWRYTGTNSAVNGDIACLFIRFTIWIVNYFIKNYKVRNVYTVCAVSLLSSVLRQVKSQQKTCIIYGLVLAACSPTLYDCLVLWLVLLCKLRAFAVTLLTASFSF